jgi:hypothetical protein
MSTEEFQSTEPTSPNINILGESSEDLICDDNPSLLVRKHHLHSKANHSKSVDLEEGLTKISIPASRDETTTFEDISNLNLKGINNN